MRSALLALGLAGLALAASARPAAAQRVPGLGDVLRAESGRDSLRPGVTTGRRDSTAADIPAPDALYRQLLAGTEADSTAAPDSAAPAVGAEGGPIEYRGKRLVFYPQAEILVLEGDAAAEQAGTRLEADRILYRSREGVVEAFRNASVSRGPSQLAADSLFYDRESDAVATYGASTLTEGGARTEGFDLRYDLDRQSGVLGGGTTTYAPWILEGDKMTKIGASTFRLEDGHFTTCDLPVPHYQFASHEIKLRQNDVIVASPVVLYFSDVPVFYLPWYVEPVERGRHSGFLRPKIGLNTLIFGSGKERNVQDLGYYHVFGDYADALLAADWYTESRFIVRFTGRYNLRYSFQGNAQIESVWNRLDGSRSQLVRFNHDHQFSPETRANVDINWSNTRSYLRRNSFDPEQILQRAFRSAANYTTRFSWGALVAGADADFRLDVNRTDYRLPDIRLSMNPRPLWGRPPSGAGGAAATDRPFWQTLQYSANAQVVARLARSQVDSLGNPLTQLPTDSLGRPIEGALETIVNEQEGRFQFTLNGPLTLLGAINATPSLSFSASAENDRLAEDQKAGGQGQLNSGLSLSTRFFKIFDGGPGPIAKLRHTVAPSVSFNYAPKPNFWGAAATEAEGRPVRESFTASLSLSQDFDAKIFTGDAPEDTPRDSLAPVVGLVEPDSTGAPPERPTQTLNVLNITNSLGFDFVRNRGPENIGLGALSTRIASGFGRTFNIGMTLNHDLVDRTDADSAGVSREVLSPHLSSITTDIQIYRGGSRSSQRTGSGRAEDVAAGRGEEEGTEEAIESLATAEPQSETSGFGPWSLNLTHSWDRPRDNDGDGGRQSLGIGAQLLPSAGWSLNYNTNYDFSENTLQGQTLALVRDLHDWQATLSVNVFPSDPQDRVLIAFSVYLRDAPDLNIPYRVRRE